LVLSLDLLLLLLGLIPTLVLRRGEGRVFFFCLFFVVSFLDLGDVIFKFFFLVLVRFSCTGDKWMGGSASVVSNVPRSSQN
jgi:hypothetical protein